MGLHHHLQQSFSPNLKKTATKPIAPEDHFIIGLDAEWVEEDGENRLLSFQWFILHKGKSHSGIKLYGGVRPTLEHLLEEILVSARAADFFWRYPKVVYLATHFSVAELHLLANFVDLKTEVDLVRRSFVTLKKPISCTITDPHRNQREIEVHLRDTVLLTPGSGSLEKLGKIHNISKIHLPAGQINRMDTLLLENPGLFTAYALRDAEIAARHLLWVANQARFFYGTGRIPLTIGEIGTQFCLSTWKSQNLNRDDILGISTRWVMKNLRRQRVRQPVEAVKKFGYLAKDSYHGGRNEAFWFGPTPEVDMVDIDLTSAYPLAMATIGKPIWDQAEAIDRIDQFRKGDLGFARASFRFPEEELFPSLPVRTDNDLLLFPLEGETHATSAELLLARDMGAEIDVIDGVRVPTDQEARPFADVIQKGLVIRETLRESGYDDRAVFYKELVNSLYGKTAQGIHEGRWVLDSRTGKSKPLAASKLTQPFFAAYTTGLIRATVSSAISEISRKGYRVFSVTTDGILTDAPETIVREAFDSETSWSLRDAKERIFGNRDIVEVKHRVSQCVITSTRGIFTISCSGDHNLILARAGIKPPRFLRGAKEQNEWLLERFFNRSASDTFELGTLRPVREVYFANSDLVEIEEERALKLEFDMKRQPLIGYLQNAGLHGDHVAFDTKPWQNIDGFTRARERWQKWRSGARVMKTTTDFDDWEDYFWSDQLSRHGIRSTGSGGCREAALRQFLRAFCRRKWGLASYRASLSNKELVNLLGQHEIQLTVQDVKNASRANATLVDSAIPGSRKVLELVELLQNIFPEFEPHNMLAPD